MIDIKFLRENPDVVRASQKGRGEDVAVVDQVLASDELKRAAITEFEQLRAEQNVLSKSVGAAKGDEKAALLANSKELAAGFVGNFMTESGPKINPMAYNKKGGGTGAHGIAQWRRERYDNLLAFAAAERAELFTDEGGYKMPDLRMQAAFVVHELKSDVGGLRLSKWGPEATTARHAADRVEAYYEVSEFSVAMWKGDQRWQKAPFSVRVNSGRDDVGHYGRRLAYAADAFNSFAHKVSSAPVSPPSNAQ